MNKNNIIKFIKSFGGIYIPMGLSKGVLFGAMAGCIMVKYLYGMDCLWWEKFLIGFAFSFIITIIRLFLSKKNNNMDSKIDSSSNNFDNAKIIKKVVKFIKKFIICGSIWIGVVLGFGYFNSIYCEPTDGASNNSGGTNTDKQIDTGNNIVKEKSESDDKSYNISGSVAKGMIKEAVQGAVEGIGNVLPAAIGGMAGASLGNAIIKGTSKLPPMQKATIGVLTAVAGGFGVTVATGLGSKVVKAVTNSTDNASSGSESTVKKMGTGAEGDAFIPSVLERVEELSPLVMILNYEIILSFLILVHMSILILI